MPIYEYECKSCGQRLEKLQKISAAPLTECPACASEELVRLVSAAGFRLAGSGWYETDFKTGSKKNLSAGGEGDKKAPATQSSDVKSDAKTSATQKSDTSGKPKHKGSAA
ncbi:zinc ribbon domain-containing protein [Vreelandella rituensis]|uniref:Zinc ribbon domain-containing protein n=1 Tax=Vreelandella rituensis TaxID=2282306 RepID=A0A368U4I1_9GAMM|nr:zinc ribbon domain-containing protein [Halomonas rituensis]RCV92079.1 zinc ribbon domain-containing protein [Halomonas rituensis]